MRPVTGLFDNKSNFLFFLLILVLVTLSACSAGVERGPFDYPDGIYDGASDLYD